MAPGTDACVMVFITAWPAQLCYSGPYGQGLAVEESSLYPHVSTSTASGSKELSEAIKYQQARVVSKLNVHIQLAKHVLYLLEKPLVSAATKWEISP